MTNQGRFRVAAIFVPHAVRVPFPVKQLLGHVVADDGGCVFRQNAAILAQGLAVCRVRLRKLRATAQRGAASRANRQAARRFMRVLPLPVPAMLKTKQGS